MAHLERAQGRLVLYTVSAFPIALRTVFPETVLQLGLVGLAAAITWLAFWMLRNVPVETTDAVAVRGQATAVTAG